MPHRPGALDFPWPEPHSAPLLRQFTRVAPRRLFFNTIGFLDAVAERRVVEIPLRSELGNRNGPRIRTTMRQKRGFYESVRWGIHGNWPLFVVKHLCWGRDSKIDKVGEKPEEDVGKGARFIKRKTGP